MTCLAVSLWATVSYETTPARRLLEIWCEGFTISTAAAVSSRMTIAICMAGLIVCMTSAPRKGQRCEWLEGQEGTVSKAWDPSPTTFAEFLSRVVRALLLTECRGSRRTSLEVVDTDNKAFSRTASRQPWKLDHLSRIFERPIRLILD